MVKEQIALNIKTCRQQHNLTQSELAEELKVSRSVIAKWENNLVTPDIESLIKIADFCNFTLDHLIGNDSSRDNLQDDFKRIYQSSPEKFDEDIINTVEYIMKWPLFKDEIYRLQSLPISKQLSIHKLLSDLIDQYEQL